VFKIIDYSTMAVYISYNLKVENVISTNH